MLDLLSQEMSFTMQNGEKYVRSSKEMVGVIKCSSNFNQPFWLKYACISLGFSMALFVKISDLK